MDKVIITVAVTGGQTTREQNPGLPITPEEIAQAAYECYNEGASIVHIHVRDPRPVSAPWNWPITPNLWNGSGRSAT